MVTRLRSLVSRVRALFRARQLEDRLNDEWRLHRDLLAEENVRQGMSAEEARRQARVALGGLDQFKQECREANAFRWLDELRQDLGYTQRVLAKSPGLTLVVVLTLALGIGANTAVVGIIDAFLLRPFPVLEPDRLVGLSEPCSYPDFLNYRNDGRAFSDMAAVRHLPDGFPDGISVDPSGELVSGDVVTANYFDVLGLKMSLGRGFLKGEDDYPGNHPVIVVSYRYWQRALGSDPEVIGKKLRLDLEPMTIIGVAPRAFRGLDVGVPPTDLWMPVSMLEQVKHLEKDPIWHDLHLRRQDRWIGVVGRLKPDVSFEQARARIDIINGQLKSDYPQTNRDWHPTLNPVGRRRLAGADARLLIALFMTAALCFLLITCTNVANLLLARASTRQREIATRLAVGATRARLIRQLLTESVALSVLALVASLGVFHFLLQLLPYFARSLNPALDIPLSLDTRILVVAAVTSAFATVLFGLAPAVVASRQEVITALKGHGFLRFKVARSRWLGTLAISQVILSVILLIGAGLFTKAILHFQSIDPGFRRYDVMVVSPSLREKYGYDQVKWIGFCRRSLELIRRLPGVRSAAWGAGAPLSSGYMARIRTEPDKASYKWIDCNFITSDYLKTLGIPTLQGRDFNEHDNELSPPVIIINETLARRYWPNQNPLGKRIQVQDIQDHDHSLFEVIGLARDAKYSTLWEGAKPFAYFVGSQVGYPHFVLHVSTWGDPKTLFDPIRKTLDSVEPGVQIGTPRLVSELISSSLSQERSMASLLGVLGLVGLLVTAVGLYGVISFLATQRTREFGIRMALGAQRTDILKDICVQGIALVLVGLSVALPCSYGLTRFIASRLHGVGRFDLTTYAAISLLCLLVAFVAVLLPARRATANPTDALRFE